MPSLIREVKPGTLAETQAAEITRLHAQIIADARRTLATAFEIGGLLEQAKATVPHGQWADWCELHLPFSADTAQRYMRLHRERDRILAGGVYSVSEAYQLLASPAKNRSVRFLAEANPHAAYIAAMLARAEAATSPAEARQYRAEAAAAAMWPTTREEGEARAKEEHDRIRDGQHTDMHALDDLLPEMLPAEGQELVYGDDAGRMLLVERYGHGYDVHYWDGDGECHMMRRGRPILATGVALVAAGLGAADTVRHGERIERPAEDRGDD